MSTPSLNSGGGRARLSGQAGPGHPMSIGSFPSFSTVNFYAGNRLNRISWLRQSSDFLNAALTDRSTRFVVLQHLNPLIHAGKEGQRGMLATLGWQEVRQTILECTNGQETGNEELTLFGPEAHGLPSKDVDKAFEKATQGLGPTSLALVFLGLDESHLEESSLPGQLAQDRASDGTAPHSTNPSDPTPAPAGVPYFALSLTYRPRGIAEDVELPTQRLESSLLADERYDFVDTRALAQAGTWPLHDAAIVAQARSLIDWNERHQFCPACSRRQYSLWAGWKRACASNLGKDHWNKPFAVPLLHEGRSFDQDGKGECPTTNTLSNFCYPRTDPTVIMAITSPDGEKILLGRQQKWPPGFYSCLAGFLEPGESVEEAVRREIFEESGVRVGKVTYHSSQPWPFPANLMMGAVGQAIEGRDTIRLDLDNELEDARFFTRAEVLDALTASTHSTFSRRELARLDDTLDKKRIEEQQRREEQGKASSAWDQKDGGSVANVTNRADVRDPMRPRPKFRIPGQTAIAHVLISAWARGDAHFAPDSFRGKM